MQSGACVRPLDALLGSLRDCLDRFPDKRYISREAFLKLWQRGLHLISGIRRNMRNHLMPLAEKLMLRKVIAHAQRCFIGTRTVGSIIGHRVFN